MAFFQNLLIVPPGSRPARESLPYQLDKDTLIADLTKEHPQWILSSYSPGKNTPRQLFGGPGRELSFEELRLRHYELAATGNLQQATEEAQRLVAEAQQQMQNAARDVNGAIKYIIDGEKEHPNRFDIVDGKTPSLKQPQTSAIGQQNPSGFQQPSSFSQPQTSQAPGNSIFGQTSPFNQPSTSQASGNTAFGQPSAFGQPASSATAFSQPSAFGQPSGLGQSAPAFGQPATLGQSTNPFATKTSAFGQPSAMNTAPVFGQPSNPSIFGQTSNTLAFRQPSNPFSQAAPSGPSPFSQTSSSTFAQPSQPPAFGQPSQPSAFGQPAQPSAFGQPSQPSIFGKPSQPPTTGQQTQTSTFGQQPSTPANSKPSPFGQLSQPAASSSFANQPVPAFSTGVSTTSIAAPLNPFAAATKTDSPPRGRSLNRTFGHPPTPKTTKAPQTLVLPAKDPNKKLHTTWGIPITSQNTRKDNQGKLTLWKGLAVNYVDEDPCFKREDGKWEKILYPDGPPQWSKPEILPREQYDDFTINAYKTMMETGDFGLQLGEGLIPELPPKREWCKWDF